MPHQPLPKTMEARRKDEARRLEKRKDVKEKDGVYQAIDGDETTQRRDGRQKQPDTHPDTEEPVPARQATGGRLSNDCVKMLLDIQERSE